jgi:hypothetical protein
MSPLKMKPAVTNATSFSLRHGHYHWGQVLPTIPTVVAGIYVLGSPIAFPTIEL